MEDATKYLIHATVTADGVVERSDVVGAVFGQTEGLLGDELDLRELRRSGKVGRIDVEVSSEGGESDGELTIATDLDKVETATLAASLETIDRVGPCRAALEVTEIEDVRAATRREVVDRAKELLRTGFEDTVMSSEEILAEVREHVRVADVTEFEGLPAGPRVVDGDAIIVVEGRADVLTMLTYGIKNAIAVEGTNVPDAVAELTERRTVTAFLDGDRGGDLILAELAQVGDVDYVATAPPGRAVEDLDHHEVFAALRNKVPFDAVSDEDRPREAVAATDGSASPAPPPRGGASPTQPDGPPAAGSGEAYAADASGASSAGSDGANAAEADVPDGRERGGSGASTGPEPGGTGGSADPEPGGPDPSTDPVSRQSTPPHAANGEPRTAPPADPVVDDTDVDPGAAAGSERGDDRVPNTLYDHVSAVVGNDTDAVRFLDADREVVCEAAANEAYETLRSRDSPPDAIVLDDILSQRLLDLAADRGVSTIVAASLGQFVKRPTAVRAYAADEVADAAPDGE